jgi:hypothetical protein
MILYGVVRRHTEEVVEFFDSREEAESKLRTALRDESNGDVVVGLVRVDLTSGEWAWRAP